MFNFFHFRYKVSLFEQFFWTISACQEEGWQSSPFQFGEAPLNGLQFTL
jgi:hypothetical protein